MNKKLTLGNDKIIGGVCSGIAEYFNIDPTLVRLFWIILLFYDSIGILPYLICWMIIPSNNN